MFYPHLNIPNSRFIFTEGIPTIDEIAESDVLVVQRMMQQGNLDYMRFVRQYGLKIIYDLDDNLWELPELNPAKYVFRQKESLDGLEACAEWADLFTVSTPTLKKVVNQNFGHLTNVKTKKHIPIHVVQNRVDRALFQPVEMPDREEVVIGWGGSNTHGGDLAHIWPILKVILKKFSHVRLELIGHSAPDYLRLLDDGTPNPRVVQRPWVHISEYPSRLASWNWDIIIAPLEEHKFNKSKSNIKMQEAGAIKRPCLATLITPYKDFCDSSNDKDLKWLLCAIESQWAWKLEELITNTAARKELGECMYQNVVDNYSIEKSVPEWQLAIETAFKD